MIINKETLMKIFVTFLSAFLFGSGLEISGMTNPEKVRNFLNVTGNWDPSLIFVMVGAISIHMILYWFFIIPRSKPLLHDDFHLPASNKVTQRLVFGAVLFGVGWGLSGLCPGPIISSLFTLKKEVFLFLGGIIIGMKVYDFYEKVTTQ